MKRGERLIKTEIRCKTTAPMFMAGSKKNEPELRAASIKGVMRYIWRAAQRSTNLQEMKREEGKLFGNADGDNTCVCPWRIHVYLAEPRPTPSKKQDLLPYRQGNARGGRLPTESIMPEMVFTVRIIGGKCLEQHINIVRLFVLTCMLGGFGRRSRKGMGTVAIEGITGSGEAVDTEPTIENCCKLLNGLFDDKRYVLDQSKSIITPASSAAPTPPEKYPYIERIQIFDGKKKDAPTLQEIIGRAAHNNKLKHPSDKFLGEGGRTRFASSILISTIPAPTTTQYYCIVTQLYCTKEPTPVNRGTFLAKLQEGVTE